MCSDERFFGFFFFCINFTGCQNSLFKLEIVFQLWVIFLYYLFPNSLPVRYFSFCNSFIWTLNLSPETFFSNISKLSFFSGRFSFISNLWSLKTFFSLSNVLNFPNSFFFSECCLHFHSIHFVHGRTMDTTLPFVFLKIIIIVII